MKSLSPIDVTVLTWLKPELDGTLKLAGSALERHVDDGQGVVALRECGEHLHQVAAILNMVELTGAARFAEEMDRLALALADSSVSGSETAFTLLMQCIVQLPDYLERLQNGHRDVPIVLLPLINDLRAVRGASPLGEESVYSANMQHEIPKQVLQQLSAVQTPRAFSETAAAFQARLLAWLNNQSDNQAASQLALSCSELCALSSEDNSRKLFWTASALLDGVGRGAIPVDKSLRQAIIQIDQEVNHLGSQGLSEMRRNSPLRVTQELLFFVSQTPDATERLRLVYDTFELAGNIPEKDEIEHAKSSLLGRNNALIASVTTVIKEDILRVKDSLDMSIRQADASPEKMAEIAAVLSRIEGTLGLIDANDAKALIKAGREELQGFVNGSTALDDQKLMAIARSLLSVELILDRQGTGFDESDKAREASEFLSSSQSQQLLEALLRECISNFALVRQAFVAFVESYWEHQHLKAIPPLLKQISGALSMYEHTAASDYLDAINAYTRLELIENMGVPTGDRMERLAEVLASLEYYLESTRDRRPNRERILDITRKSLEALHYWPLPEQAKNLANIDIPQPVIAEPQAPVAITETLHPSFIEVANADISSDGECGDPVPGFDIEAEGIDDEIRDIFLEEFNEEYENVSNLFQQWKDNPENIESIRSIRRVFHTFKGSGRLVGAKALSSFSWSMESLLNRVLDGSRPATENVVNMIQLAIASLPKFRTALLGDEARLDYIGIAETADLIASGEEVRYQPKLGESFAEVEIAASTEEIAASKSDNEIAHSSSIIDPALLEILQPEISSHLETVNAWLQMASESGNTHFSEPVFRAFHTMNGAFAMSEVSTLIGVLAPSEAMIRRGLSNQLPANPEALACLAQVVDAVQSTLDDLIANRQPHSYPELELWIQAKCDELPDAPITLPNPIDIETDLEAERLEAERIEAERLEAERLEAERLEAERLEAERLEAERIEAERIEAERIEAERLEAERLETERLEAERLEAERLEAERLEAERLEAERLEAERLEAERLEAERLEAERLEAERLEAERLEAERLEAERIEAERIEAERIEAERIEAERIEAERIEAERIEAGRIEAERLEAERLEAERIEAERIEAERIEAERIEAERLEAERLEAERLEAERLEAELRESAEYGMSLADLERLTDPNFVAQTNAEAAHSENSDQEVAAEADSDSAAFVTEALSKITSPDLKIENEPDSIADMNPLEMVDLDEELLDIFTEEAKDLLDQSDNLLVQLKSDPNEVEPLHGLQRHLHTIKGGARMAGLFSIGELSHSLESFIHAEVEQGETPNAAQIAIIEQCLDALHRMSRQVEERSVPDSPDALIRLLEGTQPESIAEIETSESSGSDDQKAAQKREFKPLSGPIDLSDMDLDEGLSTPTEVVRIRADLLDQLVNFAGEVAIYRARLEQQLGQFKTNLVELDQTTSRLREQLRRLDIETEAQIAARNIRETDEGVKDFDPLELDRFTNQQQLSRSLAESSNDLMNLQSTLDDLTRHHETLLLQQSRVSSELQEGLMRTRMLPFESLLPRLRRVLRQASQDSGKKVQLRVDGAHGEMDRTVLDRMVAPLEHLLRNAVAHGIETPKERKKSGKDETGNVIISVSHEGTEVVLSIRDDGRGMDSKLIRSKAVERGLIAKDAMLDENQIFGLITHTGFTTAESVTRLAGRGIGMDVVSNEIKKLNGNLNIQSTSGKGVEFIVRLPLNLAVTKAVFVKIGDSQFAIPIASVDGVGRIGREELDEKLQLDSPEFNYAGNRHKIYDLGNLLDLTQAKALGSMQMPMLLSRSGQDRIAICVDQVLGSQEIVVKPVGPQVTSIPGIYGASIMPDGGVVVILDLAPLVRHNAERVTPQKAETINANSRSMPLVMVVDDSITMRKVTSRILERNNYEVITARDGVEAIEKMAEQVPDLVLLDIEMPRMDGYEVAQNMKADSRLQNVPIMMITSRTGDKHRQRAFDLGVERYLGKPYQEPELMRQVNEILRS